MGAKKKNIPLHRMEELQGLGFQIERKDWFEEDDERAVLMGAHRDEHYMFLLQEGGAARIMLDFSICHIGVNSLLVVEPGQIHHYLGSSKKSRGWFVAVDPALVPLVSRNLFEDPMRVSGAVQLTKEEAKSHGQCLELLLSAHKQLPGPAHVEQLAHSLLASFVAMAAAAYKDRQSNVAEKPSRFFILTRQFRKLVVEQYKTMKSPAEYAAAMNISLSYLNEAVKAYSGSPVSYWIQREVVMEAERLLYHTENSVKEIADSLGYEDHAYFSRLFRKVAGETPGAFRKRYRE